MYSIRSGFGFGISAACSRQLAGGTNTGVTGFCKPAQPVKLVRTSSRARLLRIGFLLLQFVTGGPDSLRLLGAVGALLRVRLGTLPCVSLEGFHSLRQGHQIGLQAIIFGLEYPSLTPLPEAPYEAPSKG